MSEFVLVKFEDNWADEMDVAGFITYKKDDWEVLARKIKSHKKPFSICIGTNEEIDYANGTDLFNAFKIVGISKSQYDTLETLFGGKFGETSALDNIECIVEGDGCTCDCCKDD